MPDIGINLRATAVYVTDGATEVYLIDGDTYPQTRSPSGGGSLTYGWTDYDGSPEGRNRDNAIDVRLAGIQFSGGERNLRIDVTGDMTFDIAAGDAGAGNSVSFSIRDSLGEKFTLGEDNLSEDEFTDASDTVRTSVADWVSNHTPSAQHTIVGHALVRYLDVAGNVVLTHVRTIAAAAAGTVGCLTQGGLVHPRLTRGRLVA